MASPVRRSRRRPVRTTGTYPPEGSHSALGRGHPAAARQWPILAVLVVAAIGVAVVEFGSFRAGTITVGVAPLLGALLRFALPDVGLLAVRSRWTDVTLMGVLGVLIVLLALAAQPDPVIQWQLPSHVSSWFGRGD